MEIAAIAELMGTMPIALVDGIRRRSTASGKGMSVLSIPLTLDQTRNNVQVRGPWYSSCTQWVGPPLLPARFRDEALVVS